MLAATLAAAGGQGEKKAAGGPLKLEWLVGSWLTQDHPDEQQAYDIEKVFEKEYPDIKREYYHVEYPDSYATLGPKVQRLDAS